jgi:hypothetical protein
METHAPNLAQWRWPLMTLLAASLFSCEPGDMRVDDLGEFEDGLAAAVPGTLQAEAYNAGGEGVGYHDTTSTNIGGALRVDGVDIEAYGGGYHVGWTEVGEWLAYNVSVANAGKYTFTVRLASAYSDARSIQLEIDNVPVGKVTLTGGTGYYAWKDVSVSGVALAAGTRALKLVFQSNKVNVDSISVKAEFVPAPLPSVNFVVGGAYLSNTDPAPVEGRAGVPFETVRNYYSSTGVGSAITRVKANIAAKRAVSHVSFKLPYSWAQMANGAGDVWAKDVSAKLQAAIAGTPHVVRIAMHHEPENDTGTNAGNTVAGRDAWKNMQARLAPFFDKPGIQYILVLMGYHSFSTASSLYPLWKLDACVPNTPAIKGIGYDIYERFGSEGATHWTNWDSYMSQIKAFHGPRNLAWGLSETGVSATGFSAKTTWFSEMISRLKANGGSWFDYFNTNLNSVSAWYMDPGSPREKAFIEVLKNN